MVPCRSHFMFSSHTQKAITKEKVRRNLFALIEGEKERAREKEKRSVEEDQVSKIFKKKKISLSYKLGWE